MIDPKEFITIFKAEAQDQLTKLDQGLVELEKHPDNPELVKELNRAAHTIKGSSRVMGFIPMQDVAHKIEDIFDMILQQKLVFNSNIADKIFKGVDMMRSILEKVGIEEKIEVDISSICLGLEQAKGGLNSAPIKQQPSNVQPVKHVSSDDDAFKEYIRVPVSRVNKLLNLAGEMVINKMKSSQKVSQLKKLAKLAKAVQKDLAEFSEKAKDVIPSSDEKMINLLGECLVGIEKLRSDTLALYDNISSEVFHLDPVVDELQDRMKEMRMLPCSTIFEGFPRMIRDIAAQEHKEINFEISGGSTELDRKVLERIKTPLMHILRNCIDHGIEDAQKRKAFNKPQSGTIKVKAFSEAGNVLIVIEDDGRGMDIEEIKRTALEKRLVGADELKSMKDKEVMNLIFMNGYSTSPIITDVSGRGIGLDVVRRDIENLKGQVAVETHKDLGTKFTLVLPLTIAIIKTLLIESEALLFAMPLVSIEETLSVMLTDIATVEGRMAITVRDRLVPLVNLGEVLGLPRIKVDVEEGEEVSQERPIVVVSSLDKWVGFVVDGIKGEEELFVKSLGEYLGKVRNVSGASLLGRGEVVIILDPTDLIDQSCLAHPAASSRRFAAKKQKSEKKIMIVEDTLTIRELEKTILEAQGYQVTIAVDGLDALNKLSDAHYDLIVSDIQMPRMDGFELCSTIKKSDEYRNIPVVIVTALEKDEDRRRGIEAGAQAYIVKSSFDQRNLLDTIERLIGV